MPEVIVMVLVGLLLTYTRTGKAMRAVRDSGELASISGINSDNIILIDMDFLKHASWPCRHISRCN